MMARRNREKHCDRCYVQCDRLYRVQIDASQAWYFVCDACWAIVQNANPDYRYGGTWKSKKRR